MKKKAVKIIDSNEFEEGTNIGIIGFPQGLSISETIKSISLLQLTPILQVGITSAILLFSGISNPTNFILDLFINGGSSGSPLFTEKGEVIGIRVSYTKLKIPKRVVKQRLIAPLHGS